MINELNGLLFSWLMYWKINGLMDLLIDLLKSLFTTATRSPLSATAAFEQGKVVM